MSTFVSVGNLKLPFTRLLQAVIDNAARLPQPVVVQHGHTPFDDRACTAVPFLKMEAFQEHVLQSTLVVLHGGAGSIMTALQAGKRPLVMARLAALGEHVDDHQRELVRELDAAGRILAIDDGESLGRRVADALADRSPVNGVSVQAPPRIAGLVAADLADWERKLREPR